MNIFILLFLAIFLASTALGLFLILRPEKAIAFQTWFYLKINWRVEPVDMALELRNTRIMGAMLIAVVLGVTVCAGIILAGNR